MKPKAKPASSATRLLVAPDRGQPTDAAFLGDFQDKYSFAMDEVIACQEASRSLVVRLNSCVLEISENVLWLTPIFGSFFYMAAKSLSFCIELQMNWLNMFVSNGSSHASVVVRSSDREAPPTVDELAYSMDIALGEEPLGPSDTVVGSSVSHTQPTTMLPGRWKSRAA